MSNISLVPQELLHLEECIFEGMRRDYREYGDCDGFRKRFQESIIHAEDLSLVIFRFMHWLLDEFIVFGRGDLSEDCEQGLCYLTDSCRLIVTKQISRFFYEISVKQRKPTWTICNAFKIWSYRSRIESLHGSVHYKRLDWWRENLCCSGAGSQYHAIQTARAVAHSLDFIDGNSKCFAECLVRVVKERAGSYCKSQNECISWEHVADKLIELVQEAKGTT